MQLPLPTIDVAYNVLQQEENQSEVLRTFKSDMESLAMFGKTPTDSTTCSACGRPGRVKDKCWTLVGYPPWHPLSQHTVRGLETYNNRGRGGRGNRGGRIGRGGTMQHFDVGSYSANNSFFTLAQI